MAFLSLYDYPMTELVGEYLTLGTELLSTDEHDHEKEKQADLKVQEALAPIMEEIMGTIPEHITKKTAIPKEKIVTWKEAISNQLNNCPYFFSNSETEKMFRCHYEMLNQISDRLDIYLEQKNNAGLCPIYDIENPKKELYEEYREKVRKEENTKLAARNSSAAEKAAAKKTYATVQGNHALLFGRLEKSLAATNSFSRFTKQSKQFSNFRKVVESFNEEIRDCRGVITKKNAARIAELIVKANTCCEAYMHHCRKHPESNSIRIERMRLVNFTVNKMNQLRNFKKIDELCNKMDDSKELSDELTKAARAAEPILPNAL